MVTLLTNLFIKKKEETQDPAVRRAYGVLCSVVGIALNVLLVVGMFAAGLISGSVAVLFHSQPYS